MSTATTTAPGRTPAARAPRARAVYSRVAVLGLLLLGAAPLLMLITAAVSGMSLAEDGPFFALGAAIPLATAALAWRFGAWSKILAIAATLVAAAGLFWIAFGLGVPGSFGDFVPGLSFVLGFVLALGGSVAALVQGRRGNLATSAAPTERRIVVGAVVLLAAGVVVSGVLTALAGRATADVAGTTVTMSDFAFAEGGYAAQAGEPATFVAHNSDGFVHDIAIPALDVDPVQVLPGADAVIELPAADPGTYTVYCTLHSDTAADDPEQAGMAATLVIE
jgi:plastocyanin